MDELKSQVKDIELIESQGGLDLLDEKEQLVEDFMDRCKAALEECVLTGEYVA